MAPSASPLIPFEVDNARKARALQNDVQQIVKQKGAFRQVTEEKLLANIARPEEVADDDQSDLSSDAELETIQATREKLFTTKAEVTRLLQTSMNETNTLLDLVSWALSGNSKVAQTTMSPALKGGVPVGSAELRSVPTPFISRNAKQRLDDTSTIVRLQAFDKCSERLMAASDRLQTEAQHQSRYWDQMAKLRSEGWPISRLPRDSRSLVVHLASAEASPRYRAKGLLPLRRGEGGDLTLPEVQRSDRQRRLMVTVRRRDRVTGRFQPDRDTQENQSSLGTALDQAKDVVFEEEMFSEASKEAQLISNLGAKVRSSSIEIDVTADCSISVSYLPQTSRGNTEPGADDDIAAFVGTSLRTMLIAEYQNKYRTRSAGPAPPMTPNQRPSPEYVMIRPIIAQIRHNFNVFPIVAELRKYQKSLEQASLSMSVETNTDPDTEPSPITLQSLRQITRSCLRITLQSGTTLNFNVETQLAPPRFGTQFNSTEYKGACGSGSLPQTSSSVAAIQFLDDFLTRKVCQAILSFKYQGAEWRVQSLFPLELVLMEGSKSRATLASTCNSGNFAVSVFRMTDRISEKVIYNGTRSTLVRQNGLREDSDRSLEEVVGSWVQAALQPDA